MRYPERAPMSEQNVNAQGFVSVLGACESRQLGSLSSAVLYNARLTWPDFAGLLAQTMKQAVQVWLRLVSSARTRRGGGWCRGDPSGHPQGCHCLPEVSVSFCQQTSPPAPSQELQRTFVKALTEAHSSLVPEPTRAKEFIKSKEGPRIII